MSRAYEDPDAETDMEREAWLAEREQARRDRLEDYAPLPDNGRTRLVCPNGHAMDDGLFNCPACGAYRPSGSL